MGLWKCIKKTWNVLNGIIFYLVGNGQWVRFWKNNWCGNEPLCVAFPTLFAWMLGWWMYGMLIVVGLVEILALLKTLY